MTALIIYLLVALGFSFLCSILEASLLSITPSFIEMRLNQQKSYAKELKKYKENIDLPLAAILTINTFAHTVGAAGVGAQAQRIWGEKYLSVISAVLTLLILILSEIIPKTLGANYWKQLAPFTAKALKVIIYSPVYPIIILSQKITNLLKKDKAHSVLSRAEFQAITEIGISEGIFKDEETRILRNLMKFSRINVRSIMTPRTVMLCEEENVSIKKFYTANQNMRLSRIPIFDGSIDHTNGYVMKDDILEAIINENENMALKELKRPLPLVIDSLPLQKLFYKFIELKTQIFLVVGEYGETLGLVTMEDLIETLIGLEIMDETDNVEDMQKQARQKWEQRAKKSGII